MANQILGTVAKATVPTRPVHVPIVSQAVQIQPANIGIPANRWKTQTNQEWLLGEEWSFFFVFLIVVFCPGFVCLFRFREVLVCVFGRGGGRSVFLFECFCWVSQWLLMKIGALLF